MGKICIGDINNFAIEYDFGGGSVDKHVFYEVVDSFLKEYAKHWF